MSYVELLKILNTTEAGLTNEEAKKRLAIYGPNKLKGEETTLSYTDNIFTILLSQFRNPLLVIFLFISGLYFFVGSPEDALIIIITLSISTIIALQNERGARDVIKKLFESVKKLSTVLRDGKEEQIPFEYIVPGDIIILKAGDSIPADSLILESKDLFVNESMLTGESYPVEKLEKILLPQHIAIRDRTNSLFMGTFVVSGFAKAVAVETGTKTKLGKISERLRIKPAENEFEKNVRSFGYFLLEVTSIMVITLLSINSFLGRPIIESLLFSLALSIGLTPQLLPAIITVSLAKGAKNMATRKAIVKRLQSIESLGSMNILCSDKTGTLTIGEVKLQSAEDVEGNANNKVLLYAYLNAAYQTGFANPIDEAIKQYYNKKNILQLSSSTTTTEQYSKLDEIPYDFIRKRLSILVIDNNNNDKKNKYNDKEDRDKKTSIFITKGALHNVLEICSSVELPDGRTIDITPTIKQNIIKKYQEWGDKGFRVLGIAYRYIAIDRLHSTQIQNQNKNHNFCEVSLSTNKQGSINNHRLHLSYIAKDDENNMIFLGFIILFDPLKPGVIDSISNLKRLGISLKVISGDNKHVASYVAQEIGLSNKRIITGSEITHMGSEALQNQVVDIDVFAEIEPNQKEQIILALKKSRKKGNYNNIVIRAETPVIGYMGDGINDASAIHAADIGISVDTAADVVKEAADIVLLQKDLSVLTDGILEGRKTLANTLKYIFMATSSNFGNILSMAGASLFLPFLPLLPKQILLTNLLIDIPEMALSTDEVDDKMMKNPRRLDMKVIRNFMLLFGGLVTVFDFFMFGILVLILHTTVSEFRTAWFIESVVSACVIVLIIRNKTPYSTFLLSFVRNNKPGKYLILSIIVVASFSILVPFVSPFANFFELIKLPISFYFIIILFELLYVLSAEIMKKVFFKKTNC